MNLGDCLRRSGLIEFLLVVAVISLVGALVLPASAPADRDRLAADLIRQLDEATERYQLVFGAYPPGDGSGSFPLVRCLNRPGPGKARYFDFTKQLLVEGHIANPVDPEREILHYRFPGVHRPKKFDLWARDGRGNPMGAHNW